MPAHFNLPTWDRTLGPEVGAVCELAGFSPDPEQQLMLDATFGLNERGRSVAAEIACICCRQNLKTGYIKMVELGWLFVTEERLVVHSAHEFNTSSEAHRDLSELIESSPSLTRKILSISNTAADLSIETKTGARLVFKTRTKSGARGLSGRKLVIDEAFAAHAYHMGAVRPLISAQPDPQILFASSGALGDSDVLHALVKRGRKGGESRLLYCEWCGRPAKVACAAGEACTHVYGEAVGCAMDDPSEWQRGNPAMGRRIERITIEDERRACVSVKLAHEFGRERHGWHDDPVEGVTVIDLEQWAKSADVPTGDELADATTVGDALRLLRKLVEPVALALDVQPDGVGASITVTTKRGDGRWWGELVADGIGTDWTVDRAHEIALKARACVLVIDATGPAGELVDDLLAAGWMGVDGKPHKFVRIGKDDLPKSGETRLHVISGPEYAQACLAVTADVRNDRWRHLDQAPMNDAVVGVRTKPLADGYKWSRKDSTVNISPFVGVTLGRHGYAAFHRKTTAEPWVISG